MKMMKSILGLTIAASLLIFVGCGDDDDGDGGLTTLDVTEITASGTDFETGEQVSDIDLYGATSAEDVPLDATIQVVFDDDIDEDDASDHITVEGGSEDPVVNTSVSGDTVTVTFDEELERGTTYTLTIGGGIKGFLGGILNDDVVVTFETAGRAEVEPPQSEGQVAYWSFDGNANDALGTYNATEEVDVTYIEDRFGQPASAVSFNGTTSIIEVPDATPLVETNDFTLSTWVKVDSIDHPAGHFVVGLGGANGFVFEIAGSLANAKLAARYDLGETNAGEDLWIDATGNTDWQGWVYSRDYTPEGGFASVIADEWTHFVFVYNSSTKVGSAYVNGELAKSQDFNLWPEDDQKRNAQGLTWAGTEPAHTGNLAFGFITDRESTAFDNEPWGNYENPDANHFKGELDDVRIFHAALSEEEVENLYDAEAP